MRKHACYQIVTEKYPEAIKLHIIDTGDLRLTLSWVFKTISSRPKQVLVKMYKTIPLTIRADVQLEDQNDSGILESSDRLLPQQQSHPGSA
jgi:hypothetical protein